MRTERNVAADLRAYRDWLRAQMVRADSGQPFYENALNTFYMHLGYHQRAELDAQRSVQPQAVFISNEQRAETPRVFVVESGDYEQRGLDGVYESLEAAVAGIKARFQSPYRVTWLEVRDTSFSSGERHHREWELEGQFDTVDGYSSAHNAVFTITPWPFKRLEALRDQPGAMD